MTPIQAKETGMKYSLRAAFTIFFLYEAVLLFSETQGDFANGILFFFERQINIVTILTYLVFFACFVVLGRRAGYSILIKRVKPVRIILIYPVLSAFLVLSVSFGELYKLYLRSSIYSAQERQEMVQYILFRSAALMIMLLLGWIYVTTQISGNKEE